MAVCSGHKWPPKIWRKRMQGPGSVLAACCLALLVAGSATAETGTVRPKPLRLAPDPLRSPLAPYRGPAGREVPDVSEQQRLYNYRTDLQSRQRELEQVPPGSSPRLMEERRELRQELDRLRRLTR